MTSKRKKNANTTFNNYSGISLQPSGYQNIYTRSKNYADVNTEEQAIVFKYNFYTKLCNKKDNRIKLLNI